MSPEHVIVIVNVSAPAADDHLGGGDVGHVEAVPAAAHAPLRQAVHAAPDRDPALMEHLHMVSHKAVIMTSQ